MDGSSGLVGCAVEATHVDALMRGYGRHDTHGTFDILWVATI